VPDCPGARKRVGLQPGLGYARWLERPGRLAMPCPSAHSAFGMNQGLSRYIPLPARDEARPAHVLLVNSMAMWMCAFITPAINVALPSIQRQFNLGPVALGWLPLAYLLAAAAFLVPFGRAADLWGRRLIFVLGLVVFALSSLALIFAGSYASLVAFRSGQGLGAAMMFAGSAAMVTLAYAPEVRGRAMGMLTAVIYLGSTMGPALGGVIVSNAGWRALFVVTAVIGFATLGLDLWLLGRAEWKEVGETGFDWKGSLIYILALAAFLFGLSNLPNVTAAVATAVGVLGLALFIVLESRVRKPVLDVHLFRQNRVFAFSNVAALVNYSAVWAMAFLLSLYLQYIKGLSAQTAGAVLIAGVAVQALISPFAGRLADRYQPRWVASGGMMLCAFALFLFSFLRTGTPYWYIIASLCVLGLGFGLFSSPNQTSIMGSVTRPQVGIASASLGTMRLVGQAVSIAVATLVLGAVMGRHEIQPADNPNLLVSIRILFGFFTALCVAGIFTSLARGRLVRQEETGESPLPTGTDL
jgi:EmrB/QacA subfamily drug resistance transporter